MARANGEGHIFQRGKKGIYYLEYMVNGQRKKISLKTSRRKDKKDGDGKTIKGAESLARDILKEAFSVRTKSEVMMHIAEARGILKRGNIEIKDAWKHFQLEQPQTASPDTLHNYKLQWSRFATWLQDNHPGLTDLRQITGDIAKEYALHLETKDKLSASTFNQHRDLLHRIFKVLFDRASMIVNPWEKIDRKDRDGLSRHELSDRDIKKLMASFDDKKKNANKHPEYKILMYVGRYTGMRLGDCCNLKWEDIDLQEELLETIPRKTRRINRKVIIPIFPEFLAVLQKCAVSPDETYVMPHLAKSYNKYKMGVKRDVVDIFNAAGFKTTQKLENRKQATSIIGFHSLRGSLATKLLDDGVPINVVADIIGDNIATLQAHYTKTSRERVKAAALKVKF